MLVPESVTSAVDLILETIPRNSNGYVLFNLLAVAARCSKLNILPLQHLCDVFRRNTISTPKNRHSFPADGVPVSLLSGMSTEVDLKAQYMHLLQCRLEN